jgi:hypothetical protein
MRGPAVLLVACLLGVLSSAFADEAATCTYMYNNNSQFVQSCSATVDGETITEEYNLDERSRLIAYALPAFILAVVAHAILIFGFIFGFLIDIRKCVKWTAVSTNDNA